MRAASSPERARLSFDPELRRLHRHVRFAPSLRAAAAAAAGQLFGGAGAPYVAVHLRRDGYEHYCAGRGLAHYGGRRFGVAVTRPMCFPSVGEVAAAVRAAQERHGARRVLLATNSRDGDELRALRALVKFDRWEPPVAMAEQSPELIPIATLPVESTRRASAAPREARRASRSWQRFVSAARGCLA